MKLYELTENYKQIQVLLEDETVEQELIFEALQQLEEAIEDKAENIAKLIKSIEGDIEILKVEEQRLNQRRKTLESKKDSLKQYLEEQLRQVGLEKVKTKIFTIAIQNNAPSVEIIDENVVPENFFKIEKTIQKKEILNALKQGMKIPGVQLKITQGLRIR